MSVDFTERGNRVLHYAQEEAQRFNHEFVSTEHLLLGLIKEGLRAGELGKSNIAMKVFDLFGFVPREVRLEVEKQLQYGPDVVTMGKMPHTPRAKQVIVYAREEAENISRGFLGPEHLLIGLLREEDGVAAQVLAKINFPKADEVRAKVVEFDAQKVAEASAQTKTESEKPAQEEPSLPQLKKSGLTAKLFVSAPGGLGMVKLNDFLSQINPGDIFGMLQSSSGEVVHITILYMEKPVEKSE